MAIQVRATAYGGAAYDALRRAVTAAKTGDALAPVTLVVPTNLCGVIARRALARGYRDDRSGVAGLTVATIPRVAEWLAAPTLPGTGRRPLAGSILAAAWRRALVNDAGPFGPVAQHPSTVQALVGAHRALRDVSDRVLNAIAAATPLAAHVVRLHRRVVSALADRWYDTVDLVAIAASLAPASYERLGTVVLLLPQELDQSSAALVRRLGAFGDVRAVVGLTGDARADAGVRRSLDRLGLAHDGIEAPMPPIATRVLHASDADDEVRCVIRDVVGTLGATPAHRIAILYGSADPYARLLHEHLDAAGITVNGAGVRPLREHAIARGLLDLLALAALTSEIVRRAGARKHWKETYMGTLLDDGRVLEGFVDLIYREDDGHAVVVDYKTDAVPVAAINARAGVYRSQLAAYVNALEQAAGVRVARGVLLFLTPAGSIERVFSRDRLALPPEMRLAVG